jgi:hypothetical protein
MASSGLVSSSSAPQIPFVSLTREEKQGFLSEVAVKTIQKITAGYQYRMKHYLENSNLLDIGIFYPRDYGAALTDYVQQIAARASSFAQCVTDGQALIDPSQEDLPLIEARLTTFKAEGAFFHGFVSPKYFAMMKKDASITGFEFNTFVLKPCVRPSDALKASYKKLSFLGCGECCQISFFRAILKALGEERFNFLFAANGPSSLSLHNNSADNPILCLIKPPCSEETPVAKGDLVFFKNIEKYFRRHLHGDGGGYVTLCVDSTPGQEKFTALGLDSEGLSKEEVSEQLRDQYNKEPTFIQMLSDEHAVKLILSQYNTLNKDLVESNPQQIAEIVQNSIEERYPRLSKEEFEAHGGMQQIKGDRVGHGSLDVDKIEILARASSHEKARAVLMLWQRALLSELTTPS